MAWLTATQVTLSPKISGPETAVSALECGSRRSTASGRRTTFLMRAAISCSCCRGSEACAVTAGSSTRKDRNEVAR
jgi:hypothetical protein